MAFKGSHIMTKSNCCSKRVPNVNDTIGKTHLLHQYYSGLCI